MTSFITYDIDPRGDIDFILNSPNKQKIFDGDSDHVFENPSLVGRYAVFNIEEEDGQETYIDNPKNFVRMRVSSRHLILASRTFRTMLEGPWKECLAVASKNQSGPVLIETSDWDAAALAIVLDAIHGRYQDIPKHVGIGLMTRIATIVDYYECHECLQLISDIWMADIWGKNEVPDTFCKSSLLWLYTSWVFSKPNIMDLMSRVLLQDTLDPSHINLKDLPLGQILEKIGNKRQELIGKLITELDGFRRELSVKNSCPMGDSDCSALMLGTLTRKQHNLGLLFPSPVAPYRDHSLSRLFSGAKAFCSIRPYSHCSCTIARRLWPVIEKIQKDMECYKLIA
ncbi:unnamed protein product [Fusarium graminearum]|uniref:BTB domain-containing protein n=1 Tax=Gibberella zeae TaxID=5518 RepID=A0A4E9EF30_GIBZA|nr:hypothetical protein HG531_002606 [Fusarium graminearum]CAF3501202.1 unnamed protein product [Fusarium graminearum]CAG1985986.1 unnamed protein product [Fusarium graminearum]CAG2002109.1 unnamed protein product [Fusarium graminearum]CAG2009045.1 unnamed protein product [Fusarium graminearum]